MSNITVVDVAGTGGTAIIDPYDFAEVVTTWFKDTPEEIAAEVDGAINTLADLVTAPIWSPGVDELSEFLGINITR